MYPTGVCEGALAFGDVDYLNVGARPAAQSWAISCVLLKQSASPLLPLSPPL